MLYKILSLATIVFFAAVWVAVVFKRSHDGRTFESKSFVRAFAIAWMTALLISYFFLGPLSFIHLDDEGELVVSFHKLVAVEPDANQYTHRLASGADLRGAMLVGGEFISFNRLLFMAMPLWLGILIHKAIAYFAGFFGTYLLVRKGAGCERFTAIGFAALFTVAHYRLLFVTIDIGWSLLPIAIYLVVFRIGRQWYFTGVSAFAVFVAIFSSPYQMIFPLTAALLGGALIRRPNLIKFSAGAIIIFVAIFANWSESIFAMLQVSLASTQARAALSGTSVMPGEIVALALNAFGAFPLVVGVFAFSFVTALWRRKYTFDVVLAFLVPAACYIGFNLFPWSSLGIGSVKGATSGYFMIAWIPLSILVAARCFEGDSATVRRWHGLSYRQLLVAAVLTLASGMLGHFKAVEFRAYLDSSGQAIFRNVANLVDKSWAPKSPFRIVTFTDRNHVPRPNIPSAFYSLDSFDGWLNLTPAAHAAYWGAINRYKKDHWNAISVWPSATAVPWQFQDVVSLPLLAVANVRFLISPIPLVGTDIALVDGPERIPRPYRQVDFKTLGEKAEFYGWFIRKPFRPWKVYIYEVDGALPRIYAATGIVIVDDAYGTVPYHGEIEAVAPNRAVVLRRSDARRLGFSDNRKIQAAEVVSFKLIDDGFVADWSGGDAGILVINAVHQQFFKAFVDEIEAPIVPANGVQMVVAVTKGAKNVRVSYRRPTLFSSRAKHK